MTTVLQLLIIGVMVAFNALYVAAEFATVGSRRSRVQETAEGGSRPARRLLDILQDPHRLDSYVATCQIGITLSTANDTVTEDKVAKVKSKKLTGFISPTCSSPRRRSSASA